MKLEVEHMEKIESPNKERDVYRIISLIIGILGILLWILCIATAVVFLISELNSESSDGGAFFSIGVYVLEGIIVLTLGILNCVWYAKRNDKMGVFPFAIATVSAIFSILISFVFGVVRGLITALSGGADDVVLAITFFDMAVFLVAGILLLVSSILMGKGKKFKGTGIAGSIFLLLGATGEIVSSFLPAFSNISLVTIFRDGILIIICILLIVMCVKSSSLENKENI